MEDDVDKKMNLYVNILFLTFLASTIAFVLTINKTNKKWFALLLAFCLNTITLISATWILFYLDEETRWFGMGHSGLYVLIIWIPIITWLNFVSMELVKKVKDR